MLYTEVFTIANILTVKFVDVYSKLKVVVVAHLLPKL